MKGEIANIFFTTVPLLLILVMNTILYILTWKRIRDETKSIRDTMDNAMPANMRASHRAAKAMSLFVAAFFVQWWAMALYGTWQLAGPVPQVIFHFVTTFSNLGGILNLVVYIIIRRKSLMKGEKVSTVDGLSSKLSKGSREPSTIDTGDHTEIPMTDITGSTPHRSSNHLHVPDRNTHHGGNSYVVTET